jgi:cysteine desulfurase
MGQSMREIYLDNNATTPLDPAVLETLHSSFAEEYGNASSVHEIGTRADAVLNHARERVAAPARVSADWVLFTSGGTEGNNAAVKGLFQANRNRGNHIVTTAVEHTSVLEPIKQLERGGASVTYLAPDESGRVPVDRIAAAVDEDTVLVSVMHVNNETGAIHPLGEIATAVREQNPRALVHADGVQAFGKIAAGAALVDAYTVSAHKFHGPKGVGALFRRPGVRMEPLLAGGGHEQGLRSGTENVPGINGFAAAVERAHAERENTEQHLAGLREELHDAIRHMEHAELLSGHPGVANTVLAAFPPVPGEIIVNALSERGIYVSTGAACSSRRHKQSHVLEAMGCSEQVRESSIRFSMSRFTTADDIRLTIEALGEELPRLRRAALRSAS